MHWILSQPDAEAKSELFLEARYSGLKEEPKRYGPLDRQEIMDKLGWKIV
jgi:hypothetical protein